MIFVILMVLIALGFVGYVTYRILRGVPTRLSSVSSSYELTGTTSACTPGLTEGGTGMKSSRPSPKIRLTVFSG